MSATDTVDVRPTVPANVSWLEQLLAEGRKVLAAKEEADEASREAHRKQMWSIFETARTEALKLFAPLGCELLVKPCSPAEDWNPYRHPDNRLHFEIHPFTSGGGIHVRLIGRYDTIRNADVWTWRLEDERCRYYVGTAFDARSDDNGGYYVHVYSWHETNDLAEAVAICERHIPDYQKAIAQLDRRLKASAAHDEPSPKTPAEELVAALERWHGSLAHGEE